jgi:ABC-type spermidine/putrescine transport system permease subunit II
VRPSQSTLGKLSHFALWAWTAAVLVLLYLPMLPPPVFSLGDKGVAHSLKNPSLAAYGEIWGQQLLVQAIWNSLGVALVVGLVTPVLAVLAAMAVRELRIPRLVMLLTLLPLFIPGVSMGLATAFLFERMGLEPSLLSICIVNVLWALPFAFLVVLTVMSTFDTVQSEAAWMLGSNRWRAFWDVEFPSIRPGVVGAATFSMILSFNETARTSLVQGANNTVQTYIWSTYKQIGLSPALYALMTLLILVTLILVFAFWSVSGARSGASERSP